MEIVSILLLVFDIWAAYYILSRNMKQYKSGIVANGTYNMRVFYLILFSIICVILMMMLLFGDNMLLYDMTLFYVFTIALNLLIAFLLYRCEAADAKARKEAEKVEETKARLEQIREEERRKKQERQDRIVELAKQQGCYYTLSRLYEERASVFNQYALESLTGYQLYEKKESATLNGVVGSKLGGPVLGAAAYVSSSLKNNAVDAYNEGVRKNNIASDTKVEGLKARLDELDKKINEMEEEILRKGNAE